MVVLSYGFQQPENGDRGSVWFPALNANITKLNDHTHDGSNSALLNAGSISGGTISILAASWVADGTGRYKQTVTVPSGFTYDSYAIKFSLTSTGHIIYPSTEKVTTTTFTIYTLDNTLAYTAVFR
jgi:hypothetical protein